MKSIRPRTVDLVVTGDDTVALGAAVEAVLSGRRVLLVLRSGDTKAVQSYRRRLRPRANCNGGGVPRLVEGWR